MFHSVFIFIKIIFIFIKTWHFVMVPFRYIYYILYSLCYYSKFSRNNEKKIRLLNSVRRAYTMKFFFHRWLKFSFDSFLSKFNSVYSCEMWMKFFNLQSWKCFRRKKFYQIFDKIFSSEIHFTIKSLLKMT